MTHSLNPVRGRRTADTRAVVTGAGSGIGAAFALELARRGGSVVCSDIDLAAATRTADAITDNGGKAVAMRCDVSELADVEQLSDDARSWFGAAPSFVINNAGIGVGGQTVGQAPIQQWQRTLGINLWGVIHGCHVFVPQLREAGAGSVINVASAASFTAAPRMGAYNVTKAGVLALSETLHAELAGTGVHVTVLCPTFVKTNIVAAGDISGAGSALAGRIMTVAGMSPQRVARTCLDTHDRGGLYVMPQVDSKLLWRAKRAAPAVYTRTAGLLGRVLPD